MNSNWTIKNSPFEMLNIAFKRLFPNVEYKAYFEPNIEQYSDSDTIYGFTDFKVNGEIAIVIDGNLSVYNATEIFAHELAHAAVGEEHDHDEVWEKAFSDLHDEYNRIGSAMFEKEVS